MPNMMATHRQPTAERRLAAVAKHVTATTTTTYTGPVVDCHHHFLEPSRFDGHHKILADALAVNAAPGTSAALPTFAPEDYFRQFMVEARVNIVSSVYMEVIADNYVDEVSYVEGLATTGRWPWAGAVVGCANPAAPDFEETLRALLAASPKMRGIRWILNFPGFITGAAGRPGMDYLKSQEFLSGYPLLAKYGLVFDLQLNASQLLEAAAFIAKVPEVPVCLEHIGMPVLWPADQSSLDEAALSQWRIGMQTMGALPHVVCQLDEFNWAVTGWWKTPARVAVIRSMVHECITWFGTDRCMFASNFPFGGEGLSASILFQHLTEFVAELPAMQQKQLFHDTASRFYSIETGAGT